jgi:hypothetical protein
MKSCCTTNKYRLAAKGLFTAECKGKEIKLHRYRLRPFLWTLCLVLVLFKRDSCPRQEVSFPFNATWYPKYHDTVPVSFHLKANWFLKYQATVLHAIEQGTRMYRTGSSSTHNTVSPNMELIEYISFSVRRLEQVVCKDAVSCWLKGSGFGYVVHLEYSISSMVSDTVLWVEEDSVWYILVLCSMAWRTVAWYFRNQFAFKWKPYHDISDIRLH